MNFVGFVFLVNQRWAGGEVREGVGGVASCHRFRKESREVVISVSAERVVRGGGKSGKL